MSFVSARRSESSASRRSLDGDANDDVERDESKRRSRNLSEKKRRDQFNILINELSNFITSTPRKMDKSTVLKATISFLKAHNEVLLQSQVEQSSENWKPSFLSNEEFTHLMLESLNGFIMVISSSGKIIYVSECVTSLLGHLKSDLVRNSIYDFILPEERSHLCNVLTRTDVTGKSTIKQDLSVAIINMRLGGLEISGEPQKYHLVKLSGYMKRWISTYCESDEFEMDRDDDDDEDLEVSMSKTVFVCTGKLIDFELLREMSVVVDSTHTEFSSRHSLEWKFLFLDYRAPPIIGYLPFEVLGTSGYDYYHVEDLEKVAKCHEILMKKGEGTSCHYRFLTKGQQWIWLQTRYYITYHQWNAKPEFIVGTNRVVSYADVMKELRSENSPHSLPQTETLLSNAKLEVKVNSSSSTSSSSSVLIKTGNSQWSTGTESITSGSVFATKRFIHSHKVELPAKFVPTISSPQSISEATLLSNPLQQQLPVDIQHKSISGLSSHVGSFVQSPALVSPHGLPLATFHPSPVQPTSFTPTASSIIQLPLPPTGLTPQIFSTTAAQVLGHPGELLAPTQTMLHETLLMKHAELRHQIIQQQEELRLVSEQLLMSQRGIHGETSALLPTASALALNLVQEGDGENPVVHFQHGNDLWGEELR